MCQNFSHFSGFLHHFVLAKLATSNIKVNSLASRDLVCITLTGNVDTAKDAKRSPKASNHVLVSLIES